jgi:hypothetical protein
MARTETPRALSRFAHISETNRPLKGETLIQAWERRKRQTTPEKKTLTNQPY